jgi:hypothetical protein
VSRNASSPEPRARIKPNDIGALSAPSPTVRITRHETDSGTPCEQLPAEATTMKTNTLRVREESWRKTPFDRKAVQCGYATQRYCFGRPDVREIFVGPNAERCVVFTIKVNCTTSSSYAAAQQDSKLATRLGDRPGWRGRARIELVDSARTHLWMPMPHSVAAGSFDPGKYEVSYWPRRTGTVSVTLRRDGRARSCGRARTPRCHVRRRRASDHPAAVRPLRHAGDRDRQRHQ